MSHQRLILFVHPSSELGYSERSLSTLVAALQSNRIYKPVVLLRSKGPLLEALVAAGVETHTGCVPPMGRMLFSLRRGLRDIDRIVAGRKVAALHSTNLSTFSGAIWAWRHKVCHIWHAHAHDIGMSPRWGSTILLRLVHSLSHAVVVSSHATQAWLVEAVPSMAQKCHVIFNGLPVAPPPESAPIQAFRDTVQALHHALVVSVVGPVQRGAGQDIFIEAIGLLKAQGLLGDTRFAIVGTTVPGQENLTTELKTRTNALDLDGVVSFANVDADDIWPVWFGSNIAVVPTGSDAELEPSCCAAMQAMAAGLPVIASSHGGLVDIVADEKSGLLVEPGNVQALCEALARLTGDALLRQRMGQQALARLALHFSIDAQLTQTLALYRDCLSL
jgi:glycosyltransferase involved in cell wall biosynthesis